MSSALLRQTLRRSALRRRALRRRALRRRAPRRVAPQMLALRRSAPQRSAPRRSALRRSAPRRSGCISGCSFLQLIPYLHTFLENVELLLVCHGNPPSSTRSRNMTQLYNVGSSRPYRNRRGYGVVIGFDTPPG